jgi:uracil-DNA glycosylase family 4
VTAFAPDCRACPRLAAFIDEIGALNPGYHARPVAPFGAAHPQLLIVGLAPGMHGANRTGRPFTGDHAGVLLYRTLHRAGFASRPESVHANDGLRLHGCRITNAVKCLPPDNKPLPEEVRRCNAYLRAELLDLGRESAVLALGNIAHKAVLMALGLRQSAYAFAHGSRHELPFGLVLFDSYHCSRYNTQTGRLTAAMFESVLAEIAVDLESRRTS